jgi:hypothetical protein
MDSGEVDHRRRRRRGTLNALCHRLRDVDGIIIPTTRRGYAWQGDYQLVPEPLLVAIDMGEITVR